MSDLVLRVDKPAHGGGCVGRSDGRVVFCRHSLPGEMVAAQVTGESSRFLRADAIEVLANPNPARRASPCEWFGPGLCGGCSWLHAEPEEQRRLKEQVLAETLQRIAGISREPVVIPLGLERGWRTRMTLHADPTGRLGLHTSRSDHIVAVGDCLQAAPELDLPELLERRWPPGAEVRVSVSDAGRAVMAVQADGRRQIEGVEEHLYVVGGRQFACSTDGFWQSHTLAPATLVDEVRTLVEPARTIVDLYAGVGLFGLSLLDEHVEQMVLVEGDRRAAAFARRNAAGDPRVRVIGSDVRRWRPSGADLVVLDPPRAGAGGKVVSAIAGSGAATIVYVSCEPSTLARDLGLFADHGYRPDHIRGFDLFPGTAHVETVVRLRKEST